MSLVRRMLLCLLLASAVSCSATSPAAASHPTPGPMPAGARWRGVYQGPYHIMLNVWTHGGQANGNWRAVGDRQGEFSGVVRGNLLLIDWTEHGLDTPDTAQGHGYFVYHQRSGQPDEIYGEWGLGRAGRASSWWAVKRAADPLGTETGQIDPDADDQYQDDSPACEMGNCNGDVEGQ
jgi:hypothetical protein